MCIGCYNSLPYTAFEIIRNNKVEQLFWGRTPVETASSTFFYVENTPLQHLIHQVKYKENHALGIWLGEMMGNQLQAVFIEKKIELMLPMPLHIKKEKARGYNQATLLCKGINNITNCPYQEYVLVRNTHTGTQTKKSRIERWENVQDVFSVNHPNAITGKHVALIDDVITTGASTEACAAILLSNGAKAVSVFSLAYTI